MKTRLLHLWHVVNSTYWFVPTIMIVGSVLLAVGTLWLDRSLDPETLQDAVILYLGGAEGARTLLSTVASSIITVAGVVFSITIAALTQASSQFGPRLLRNFMRDTGNQIVLGTFVATFMYCLIVLRTVYGDDGIAFVPHVSVTVAVALAAASIGVLIYFIHHVSSSLQAPVIAALVASDLKEAIHRIYPRRVGEAGPEPSPELLQRLCTGGQKVESKTGGYLQAVDEQRLIECARHHDLVIRLLCRPGDFVTTRHALAEIHPARPELEEKLFKEINAVMLLGDLRTSEQDVEFAVDQLVEIAVRSLSPGINDPFTAVHCVDWLGDAVGRLALTDFPSPYRYDSEGVLRVIARTTDFPGICDAAFDQIRQYGRRSVAVTARLLEAITAAAASARTPAQRAALLRHARMIHTEAEANFKTPHDRSSIARRFQLVHEALGSDPAHLRSAEPARAPG